MEAGCSAEQFCGQETMLTGMYGESYCTQGPFLQARSIKTEMFLSTSEMDNFQDASYTHVDTSPVVSTDSTQVLHEFGTTPSSTSKLPVFDNYPGPYNFILETTSETSGKKWLYSQALDKLFVNMGSKIPIRFKWVQQDVGLHVRAVLAYTCSGSLELPVLRCPNHSSPAEESNKGFQHVNHVMRCDHEGVEYHSDPESKHLSILVPLDVPQPGTDTVTVVYTFMCKSSCIAGMNRRPTSVIFTLESLDGHVLGRRTMKVRICSCPKRDKRKEEQLLSDTESCASQPTQKQSPSVVTQPNKGVTWEDCDDLIALDIPQSHMASVCTAAYNAIVGHALLNKRELTANEKTALERFEHMSQDIKPK